jgi:VanZ family protein
MRFTQSRQLRFAIRAWGPVILVMVMIFISSAQPKHRQPGNPDLVYFSGVMPIFHGGWETLIKKGAHVLAYGVLTALSFRAFAQHHFNLRLTALRTMALVMIFALTDEWHQSFVPGRHSSGLDIGFDFAGVLLASVLLFFLARLPVQTKPIR